MMGGELGYRRLHGGNSLIKSFQRGFSAPRVMMRISFSFGIIGRLFGHAL